VPSQLDGSEWTSAALAEAAARMRRRVQRAFDGASFRELDPPVAVHAGHSFLGLNPFYRFERAIYRSIDQAARQESERRVRRELDRGTQVERMLTDGALRMHFQSVVDLATGTPRGYEALARGPRDSAVEHPSELWRATRRVGAIGRLEQLCRTRAFEEAKGLPGDGALFFNVSGAAVRSGLLEASPISACEGRFRIVIDLSERELETGDEYALEEAVAALRNRGFAVALDDLGSGSSRLETLDRLRPDYMKVDPSVVRGIDRHPIKQEVLMSLLQFAAASDARLVAEGVETAEEAEFLEYAGVPLGQGFYWSDPLPVSALPVHT